MFSDLKRIADALESIAHDFSDMRADQKIARERSAQMLEESKQVTQGIMSQFTHLLTGGKQDG